MGQRMTIDRRHTDYAGRSVTSPGRDLDTTDDDAPDSGSGRFGREFTPVDALGVRLASVEAEVIRHGAQIAEAAALPTSREWAQMRADVDAARADARLCREQQERSAKWAPVIAWAKRITGGAVVTALLLAVNALSNRGRSQRDAELMIEQVRSMAVDLRKLQDAVIVDHAILDQHLRTHP